MPAGQQTLGLEIPARFSYGDWVRHAGVEEACNRLALWLVHGGRIWLTSNGMSGKTHLLHMLRQEHARLGLLRADTSGAHSALMLVDTWVGRLQDKAFWAVDVPAGTLPASTGLALFHLLERARDMHRPLLVAWRPADDASGPPELMSRLRGTMEYLETEAPGNDADLRRVLQSVARSRQWEIQPRILELLLQWLPRRLDVLIPALIHLEQASLADRNKRLSRNWMHDRLEQWRRQMQPPLI